MLYYDNQGVLKLVKIPIFHEHTKYIDEIVIDANMDLQWPHG